MRTIPFPIRHVEIDPEAERAQAIAVRTIWSGQTVLDVVRTIAGLRDAAGRRSSGVQESDWCWAEWFAINPAYWAGSSMFDWGKLPDNPPGSEVVTPSVSPTNPGPANGK